MDTLPEGAENLQPPPLIGTLAIDLGSTTTVVAFQAEQDPKPQLLDLAPISRREGEVPSLIWADRNDVANPLIGQQVIEAGLLSKASPSLSRDFKRWIGAPNPALNGDGVDNDRYVDRYVNRSGSGIGIGLSPEEAGECLIQQIWQRLPDQLVIRRLVLTAPVDSYRSYRSWLNQACQSLPVDEVALVDEPTAAAMGAGLPPGSKLLVVDIGGGTIDLSLVAIEGGEGRADPVAQLLRFNGHDLEKSSRQILRCARVLGKAGLAIGGRDLDRWIVGHLCPDMAISEELLNAAERLKCRLSDTKLLDREPQVEIIETTAGENPLRLTLSRGQLEEILMAQGFMDSLDKLLGQTLAAGRSNNCELSDLQGVVAVGGGARIPMLRRWLKKQTQPAPLLTPPPVEAVAVGALRLTPGVTVRDVLHRGVSLRCWNQRAEEHLWHPLFVAGQPWPTSAPLEVVLAASQDDQLELELVLGEPDSQTNHEVIYIDGIPTLQAKALKPRLLPWPEPYNSTCLPLIPAGQPGEDCLRLQFSIDANACLQMNGFDLRSGERLDQKNLGTVR